MVGYVRNNTSSRLNSATNRVAGVAMVVIRAQTISRRRGWLLISHCEDSNRGATLNALNCIYPRQRRCFDTGITKRSTEYPI